MTSHRPTRSAFTLLELLVVMAILAVATMLIAPTLSGFASAREPEFAAGQLVALGQWARTQAVSEGQVYRLNFDPNSQPQRYWLSIQESGQSRRIEAEFGREFSLPDGVTAQWDGPTESGMGYIDFEPGGRTEPVQIRLTAKNGQIVDVACLSATELLKVVEDNQPAGVR